MKKLIIATVLSTALLQGCLSFNSLADAKAAKGTGEIKEYSAAKAQVWQKTLGIIRNAELSIVTEDYNNGLILAQQPIDPLAMTAGQNVAIYINERSGKTRVEVINKKAVGAIEFASRDWDSYIIEELNKKLQ